MTESFEDACLSRVVIGGGTRRRLPFCLYPEIVVDEKRGDAESESARIEVLYNLERELLA